MILIVAMLAVLANNTTAEVRFGAARPAEAKAALPVLDGPLDGLPQEKYVGTDEKSYDGSIDPLACIVLADADTGAVLFEQNPDKRAYPASTTKILSSLLAVESDRMDELITVGSEVILPGNWSTMTPKLSEGETISLRDMVYGAMLPSGCEASAAIGVALGGSTEAFVEWMNRRAAALGMNSSHFVNANGITDADHYSTAMDLTRLCRDAIKNAELCEIASTYQYVTSPTNMCGERTLTNTNYLINPNHQY